MVCVVYYPALLPGFNAELVHGRSITGFLATGGSEDRIAIK